jgi:hypothetical protein
MMKIRSIAMGVVGALLVMGACGVAAAQTTGEAPTTGRSTNQPKQAQFDREKVTLKDHVQHTISTADTHIDALKKKESTDKAAAQERDRVVERRLSDLRDELEKDLDKIDNASAGDWRTVRPLVEADLKNMQSGIKTAANITHAPTSTGAANKQPPSKP